MSGTIRAPMIIGSLIVVFNIFLMLEMETVGVLIVVVVLIFICMGMAPSYSTYRTSYPALRSWTPAHSRSGTVYA